tara:strand:- start:1754 stop:2005 length:252 start_codon:yes stop_codon:yes gene_type:complete
MKKLTLAKGMAGMDGKELLCAMSFEKEDTLQQILTTALFMALSESGNKKFDFTISLDLKPISEKEWEKARKEGEEDPQTEYLN